MDTVKKVWLGIVGLVAALGTALFFVNKSRKEAESNLESAEHNTDKAVTDIKINSLQDAIVAYKKQADEDKAKKLSDEELAKKLNE